MHAVGCVLLVPCTLPRETAGRGGKWILEGVGQVMSLGQWTNFLLSNAVLISTMISLYTRDVLNVHHACKTPLTLEGIIRQP